MQTVIQKYKKFLYNIIESYRLIFGNISIVLVKKLQSCHSMFKLIIFNVIQIQEPQKIKQDNPPYNIMPQQI